MNNITYNSQHTSLRWAITKDGSGPIFGVSLTLRRRSQNPHHCNRHEKSQDKNNDLHRSGEEHRRHGWRQLALHKSALQSLSTHLRTSSTWHCRKWFYQLIRATGSAIIIIHLIQAHRMTLSKWIKKIYEEK